MNQVEEENNIIIIKNIKNIERKEEKNLVPRQ